MATVNIIFADAGMGDSEGGLPVYNGRFRAVETITSTASSQATAITAVSGDVARIKVVGNDVWVSAPDPAPEAVADECWYLADGDILDLGHLRTGDKVAVLDA